MKTVEKFTFAPSAGASFDVRVVEIDGAPWFVAADVAHCLALEVSTKGVGHYLKRLSEDERNTVHVAGGIRGNPNKVVISESGLYKLIMRSDKPDARRFQDWVTREVLPSIRKHGGYTDGQESLGDTELLAKALKVAESVIRERTHQRDQEAGHGPMPMRPLPRQAH
ncbi:hypothetical protein MHZ93_23370 [Roseomonas sp. ACRSG]|nr:hypothetical protein [Roseomonas sp. ACRSG]